MIKVLLIYWQWYRYVIVGRFNAGHCCLFCYYDRSIFQIGRQTLVRYLSFKENRMRRINLLFFTDIFTKLINFLIKISNKNFLITLS